MHKKILKPILILLLTLVLIEVGFQFEHSFQKNKSKGENSKNGILIIGGSIIHHIRDEIKAELLANNIKLPLQFLTFPSLSSFDVLEILKKIPSNQSPSYVFIMIGNNETDRTILDSTEENEINFTLMTWVYLKQAYNKQFPEQEIFQIIKEKLDLTFSHNLNTKIDSLKYYFQVQDILNSARLNSHQKNWLFSQLRSYLLNMSPLKFLKSAKHDTYLSKSQVQKFKSLMFYLSLFDDHSLSASLFSLIILKDPVVSDMTFQKLSDLYSQISICSSQTMYEASKLDLLDKINLCHVINKQKEIKKKNLSQFPIDPVTFINAYLFAASGQFYSFNKETQKWLGFLSLKEFTALYQNYMKNFHDDKDLSRNIQQIKKQTESTNTKLALIHYPGYDSEKLIEISEELNILHIKNSKDFLSKIEKHGFDYYFADQLDYKTGHLNKRGAQIWVSEFVQSIKSLFELKEEK